MAFSQYEILSEKQKDLHQNENFMSIFVVNGVQTSILRSV